jgi:hypothetical protein
MLENKMGFSHSQSKTLSLSQSRSYSEDGEDNVMQKQSYSRSRSGTFSNLDSLNSYSEDTQSEQVDPDAAIKKALRDRLERNYDQQIQKVEEPKSRTRCCTPTVCITKNRVYATCITVFCGSLAYILHSTLQGTLF